MAIKKVFIAGAVCNHCGAIDRVQRCKSDDSDDYWMECRVCGMRQEMPTAEEAEATPTTSGKPKPIQNINDLGLKHR